MFPPHPTPERRASRALLAAVLALALASCGDSSAVLESAQRQLAAGRAKNALALLERVEGERADALRHQAKDALGERERVELELEHFRAQRGDRPSAELFAELEKLEETTVDRIAREAIASEISATVDWVAERNASRPYKRADLSAKSRSPRAEIDTEEDDGPDPTEKDPLLERVLEDIEIAREARSWAEALSIIDLVISDAPEHAREMLGLRHAVVDAAATEAADLLVRVDRADRSEGVEVALAILAPEVWRYPDAAETSEVYDAFEDLNARMPVPEDELSVAAADPRQERERPAATSGTHEAAPAPAAPGPAAPGPAAPGPAALAHGAPAGASALQLGVDAVTSARDGDLARARDLWREAAARAESGAERERYELRAYDADQRLLLRASLARAFAEEPDAFAELGLDAVTAEGVHFAGDRASFAWDELPWERLEALCRRVDLSPDARVGRALEQLYRDAAEGPRGGLAELARLVERDALDRRRCWGIVAAYRAEPVPSGGYVFRSGAWISERDLERERHGLEVDALAKRVARASAAERDAAYDELVALGRQSGYASGELEAALIERWNTAVAAVSKSRLEAQFETVAKLRTELDERRRVALELIFDTDAYFYPYDPPARSDRTVTDYWEVQREVERLVGRVRELWEKPVSVKLSSAVRDGLTDLAWVLERRDHARGISLPEDWHSWWAGVDGELVEITVATFAWDRRESAALATDRDLLDFNEVLWQRASVDGSAPSSNERNQVRITNEYRRMMGRPVLAWNRKIQVAAGGHSEYMANTGNFGHFEPEHEGRRTPRDRMRTAGYDRGGTENCNSGRSDARSAHEAWLGSSGHHRNLLDARHREMASALVSSYWTQNFGNGTDFRSELDEWRN